MRIHALRSLIDHRQYINDVGCIDHESVRDILSHCDKETLARIEDATFEGSARDLSWYTWHFWHKHYLSTYAQPPANFEIPELPGECPEDYVWPKGITAEQGDWRCALQSRQAADVARTTALRDKLRGLYQAADAEKNSRSTAEVAAANARRGNASTTAPRGASAAAVAAAARNGAHGKLLHSIGLSQPGQRQGASRGVISSSTTTASGHSCVRGLSAAEPVRKRQAKQGGPVAFKQPKQHHSVTQQSHAVVRTPLPPAPPPSAARTTTPPAPTPSRAPQGGAAAGSSRGSGGGSGSGSGGFSQGGGRLPPCPPPLMTQPFLPAPARAPAPPRMLPSSDPRVMFKPQEGAVPAGQNKLMAGTNFGAVRAGTERVIAQQLRQPPPKAPAPAPPAGGAAGRAAALGRAGALLAASGGASCPATYLKQPSAAAAGASGSGGGSGGGGRQLGGGAGGGSRRKRPLSPGSEFEGRRMRLMDDDDI